MNHHSTDGNYSIMDPDNYEMSALRAEYPDLRLQSPANNSTSGGGGSSGFWTLEKVLVTLGILIGIGILVPGMVLLISIVSTLF